MRVITGSARGKKLKTLDSYDVRPTSDRVKEAIFSIIHFDLEGSVILDLFSGSGQLGIEALSRGARHATFVDSSKNSADVTKENLTNTGFLASSRVVQMESIEFLRATNTTFDVALLDPPYNKGILHKVLPVLEKKMNPNGIVVCEHEKGAQLAESYGSLYQSRQYNYGKIYLTLFKIRED